MRKIIIIIFMIFTLALGMNHTVQAEETKKVIRVGNFESENFLMEKDGRSQGYAVDYLEEISKYTGWKYEYVYDTWTNCLNMLENGEIDMICIANYTDERSERFLYSKYSFGYEYTLMYVLPETDIFFQDYDAMQGKRIGMMKNDVNADNFMALAEEKKLEYDETYFDTDVEIIQALYDGNIDVAVVGSMQNRKELKLVERLQNREIYCIFNKEDVKTRDTFDRAMEEIVMNEGNIQGRISKKYYSTEKMSCGPVFTREEVAYIEAMEPVKIRMLWDTRPLGYVEDGERKGIFWEYFKLISGVSGLEFEVLESSAATIEDEIRKIAEDKAITFCSRNAIEAMGLDDEVTITSPVASNSLAYVKRKEDSHVTGRTDYTFAITREMSYLPPLIEKMSPDYKVKYYDSAIECFDAVLKEEADILIQDLHVCRYWLKKPIYEQNLTEYQGIDYENSMCIVIPKDQQILASIINKSINYISEEKQQNVITMEFVNNSYEKNIGDILYEYRNWIIIITLIVIVLGVICRRLISIMSLLKITQEDYEDIQMKMNLDDLTNAYNRSYFYTYAKEMIDSSEEDMCIVMMDISNFKIVNDLYGMENGDKVLADVADILIKLSDSKDYMVSRFNGDHFFMCMTQDEFRRINFPRRFNTHLNDLEIMFFYGVFFVEDKDIPVNIMCDRASMALHNIEDNSIDCFKYYSEEERSKILQKQEIENEMEKALEEKQFSLYVQPKYNVDENKIVGGEALVRWIHPQKGMISPAAFIEIFEKNGFIIPLDYYIWEECCRFLGKMKRQNGEVVPISINVSRAHFYGKELRDKLKELIQKYCLEPKDLILEITETICAQDHDTIYSKLRELQEDGFKVAMDDFGSGYSSLNMLKEMPLDIIKMDLRFLDGGENEEKSHNILKTLILLAKQMNLEVVVEGVETGKQVDFLKNLQDVIAQGYFYSRPVESEKYEHMLEHE